MATTPPILPTRSVTKSDNLLNLGKMEYEQQAFEALKRWQKQMLRRPSALNHLSKKMQAKMNSYIPEKVHRVITSAIKQMVRGVLFGAQQITGKPATVHTLQETEEAVQKLIKNYKHTAAVEGGLTGAG